MRGQAEQFGHLDREGAGVAVGRLGGGQDQVGLDPLERLGQHLRRSQGVGALQGCRR